MSEVVIVLLSKGNIFFKKDPKKYTKYNLYKFYNKITSFYVSK